MSRPWMPFTKPEGQAVGPARQGVFYIPTTGPVRLSGSLRIRPTRP